MQDGKLIIVQEGNPARKRTVWVLNRASKFENERVSQFILIRCGVLIQQVCKPDFDRNVRYHLNITCPNRWIGRGGPVPWPPDLTPLNYFLLSSMKNIVYGTPVTSEEDLSALVHAAIESLTRQLHLLCHVCEAQHRLCRLCNDVGGTQFGHRL